MQGSRYGDSCCVNLGIHLTFLPTVLNRFADPRKITESLCEFRRRLAPHGQSDCWWRYGDNESEASRSADKLVEVVAHAGFAHFDRFRTFPVSFEGITPQALAAGDFSILPGDITRTRAALAMARIAAHLGQTERARQFANVGLATITGMAGAGIARDLSVLAGDGGTA